MKTKPRKSPGKKRPKKDNPAPSPSVESVVDSPPPVRADPTKVSPLQAADLLSKEGNCLITEAMIRQDIAEGCPVNVDGQTINLILYGSWLLKQAEN